MRGAIFLIQDDGQLVEMNEQPYDTEDLLQKLLADYPNLLAGEQMDSANPRRWLLISREVAVPGEEAGAGSVDHVFLDQDAIPTLVEVKRSANTQIRREVVGQMLDYAANAVVYLPVESIRARFEQRCVERMLDPEQEVADALGIEATAYEAFWGQVKTNLQAGRVRMVFVADAIPTQLRRIVEFLNEQMDPAEVLAVEIKQFVGQGNLRTLVPKVVGQTAEAEHKKGSARETRQWDEASFFQNLEQRRDKHVAEIARRILEWARQNGTRLQWGRGIQDGSFVPVLEHNKQEYKLFALYSYGKIQIYFSHYQKRAPFDAETKRTELLERLNACAGVSISPDQIDRYPSIDLSAIGDEAALQSFLNAFEWFISEVRAT